MPLPPTVLSMILCDNVHRDATTGKFFYLGTFSAFGAAEFPATVPLFYVCVALTDGTGSQEVSLRVVDARQLDPEPLHGVHRTATFPDRFVVLDTAFPFQNVTFPAPGEYRVQLTVEGELLMERRIVLIPVGDETRRPEEP